MWKGIEMKKWALLIVILITLLAFLPTNIPTVMAEESEEIQDAELNNGGWVFRRSWGGEGDNIDNSGRISLSRDGKLVLLQKGKCRVTIIDTKGEAYQTIDVGRDKDECIFLGDLAVGPDNSIYVTAYHPGEVLQYSANGEFVQSWKATEPGEENIFLPDSITIHDSGLIFIADYTRILVYSSYGDFLRKWDTKINGTSDSYRPWSVAVDGLGHVFVTEYYENNIYIYDHYGNYISHWDACPQIDGCRISTIGTTPENTVLVQITDNTILEYTGQGQLLEEYHKRDFGLVVDYEVDKKGNLFTIIDGVLVERFDDNRQKVYEWKTENEDTAFSYPGAMEVTMDGKILVSDTYKHRIQVFDNSGGFLFTFGGSGAVEGRFYYPSGVYIDDYNKIYVADTGNKRIQVFSPQFSHLKSFPIELSGDDYLVDIAVDVSGNMYALLSNGNVMKLSSNGSVLGTWFVNQYHRSINIINHQIYIGVEGKLLVYDLNGNFIREMGNSGTNLPYVYGIDVDSDGYYYLASQGGHPGKNFVDVYDSVGNLLYRLGKTGIEPGEFFGIVDVKVYQEKLYVLEQRNGRVQVFSQGVPSPDPYSGLVQNGSFEAAPPLAEWTYGGQFPVSLTNNALHGQNALSLGKEVAGRVAQGQGKAYAYTNFYVDPNWQRPVLSFDYNMFVNEIKDFSDFYVEVQDGVGLNHLAEVLHDGFDPCSPGVAPSPGRNLGWRSAQFDLSPYKGQHIRIVFSNRNRWDNAWGIWTHVDNVQVWDYGYATPPQGPNKRFLPMVSTYYCDPVGKEETLLREHPITN